MFDKIKDSGRTATTVKPDAATTPPAPPVMPPARPLRDSSIIGAGLVIQGDLSGSEDIVIEGRFEGTVNLPENTLRVAEDSDVRADVRAGAVVVEGRLAGDVVCADKLVMSPGGRMEGNIVAPRVALADGARFKGRIDMDSAEATADAPRKVDAPPRPAAGGTASAMGSAAPPTSVAPASAAPGSAKPADKKAGAGS